MRLLLVQPMPCPRAVATNASTADPVACEGFATNDPGATHRTRMTKQDQYHERAAAIADCTAGLFWRARPLSALKLINISTIMTASRATLAGLLTGEDRGPESAWCHQRGGCVAAVTGDLETLVDLGKQPYVAGMVLEQSPMRGCPTSLHVPGADAHVVVSDHGLALVPVDAVPVDDVRVVLQVAAEGQESHAVRRRARGESTHSAGDRDSRGCGGSRKRKLFYRAVHQSPRRLAAADRLICALADHRRHARYRLIHGVIF
jgi:hypothetical protein